MMEAVISGSANVAMLVNGDEFSSLHVDNLDAVVARRPADFQFLFGDAEDLQFLQDTSIAEIKKLLSVASDAEEALHLALFLFDSDLPSDVRQDAANELNDLLANNEVARQLQNVLYAQPLPPSADVSGAQACCEGDDRRVDCELLRRLVDRQSVIQEVRVVWNQIPSPLFDVDHGRSQVEAVFVREGVFRELVLSRSAGESVAGFLRSYLLSRRPNDPASYYNIVQAWVAPLSYTLSRQPTPPVAARGHVKDAKRKVKCFRTGLDSTKASTKSGVKAIRLYEIGHQIRAYRKRAAKSIRFMATQSGLTAVEWNALEQGRLKLPYTTLCRILELLGIPCARVFGTSFFSFVKLAWGMDPVALTPKDGDELYDLYLEIIQIQEEGSKGQDKPNRRTPHKEA